MGDEALDHSILRRLPRHVNASVDLSSTITDQPSFVRLRPAASSLWNRKLSTVQKKLRDIDQVRANVRRTL